MSQDLRAQIYDNLKLKDTDELLEIWEANNRSEWSDLAFEVIADLLVLRLVEVPPQPDPVYTSGSSGNDDEDDENEDRFLDDEDSPVFYKPQQVLLLGDWLRWGAIATVVISILRDLTHFPSLLRTAESLLPLGPQSSFFGFLLAVLGIAMDAAIAFVVMYLPLRALAQILHILMEMEFNSRPIK